MEANSHLIDAHPSSSTTSTSTTSTTSTASASLEGLLLSNGAQHELLGGPRLVLGGPRCLGSAAKAKVVNDEGKYGNEHRDDDDGGESG